MTTLPNLDGLIALARQDGVDIRPTLLRVLTDLYVQKDVHTRGEEDHFTELSLSLLAGLDVSTRAAIAKKLAPYAQAPQAVVASLARDVIEVAEPVLTHSPRLSGDDLVAIIRDCGPAHAAAIAARHIGAAPRQEPIAPADAGHAMPLTRADMSAPATGHELGLVNGGEPGASDLAQAEFKTPHGEPVDLGDYFLSAGASERRLLLANLDDGALTRAEQALVATSQETISALEAAALQQRPEDFARALETALSIPAATAQKIVADETGEPVAVVAKALCVPSDAFLRIILFLNPAVGHSVERVFALVDLYDQLSAQAALHVVSSWQERAAPAGERKAPRRHQPLLWDDERRGAQRTCGSRPPLSAAAPGQRFRASKPVIRKDHRLRGSLTAGRKVVGQRTTWSRSDGLTGPPPRRPRRRDRT